MSDFVARTKNEISRRERENKAGSGKLATIKTIGASLWHILAHEKEYSLPERFYRMKDFFSSLRELQKVCSAKKLRAGEGIYADYFFNGENIDYDTLDKKVKKGILPSHTGYYLEPQNLRKLLTRYDHERAKYRRLIQELERKHQRTADENFNLEKWKRKLQSNELNPMYFGHDSRAQKRLRHSTQKLIKHTEIDKESIDNLMEFISLINEEGLKGILLSNHTEHTDTNVLDVTIADVCEKYLHQKNLPVSEQKYPAFVGGLFMSLSPGVGPYAPAFDMIGLLGHNDAKYIYKHYATLPDVIDNPEGSYVDGQPVSDRGLISVMQNYVKQAYLQDAHRQILTLYPGGTRSSYGGSHPFPKGSEGLLAYPQTVLLPTHMVGTGDMRPAERSMIWGFFNVFRAQKITIAFDKPIRGGERTPREIYEIMVRQRDILQPEWRHVEKIIEIKKRLEAAKIKQKTAIQEARKAIADCKNPSTSFVHTTRSSQEYIDRVESENTQLSQALDDAMKPIESIERELYDLFATGEVGEKAKDAQPPKSA